MSEQSGRYSRLESVALEGFLDGWVSHVMDLKDLIHPSLVEIAQGIEAANDSLADFKVAIVSVGGGARTEGSTESESRIRFTVPMAFPQGRGRA